MDFRKRQGKGGRTRGKGVVRRDVRREGVKVMGVLYGFSLGLCNNCGRPPDFSRDAANIGHLCVSQQFGLVSNNCAVFLAPNACLPSNHIE